MGNYYSDSDVSAQADAIAIVFGGASSVLDMDAKRRGKALTPEQNERIRRIVDEFVREKCDGNQTLAGERLGLSQSLVSQFLKGEKGVGPKFIVGIAEATGYSIDYIYGRTDYPYVTHAAQLSGKSGTHRIAAGKHSARAVVINAMSAEFHPYVVQRIAGMDPTEEKTCRWWVEQLETEQGRYEAGVYRDATGSRVSDSVIPEPKRRR